MNTSHETQWEYLAWLQSAADPKTNLVRIPQREIAENLRKSPPTIKRCQAHWIKQGAISLHFRTRHGFTPPGAYVGNVLKIHRERIAELAPASPSARAELDEQILAAAAGIESRLERKLADAMAEAREELAELRRELAERRS